MGLIGEFNKLHIGLKSGFLSILCTMPFFLIAIFLFGHNLIDKIPNRDNFLFDFNFYFLVSLCFCFTLTWIFTNILISFGVAAVGDNLLNSGQPDGEAPFVLTFVYSIGYLTLTIILNHYWLHWSLMKFVFGSHILLLIRLLWTVLWWSIIKIFS